MSATALTTQQVRAVQALVANGRLRTVPADASRAARCLEIADERLSQIAVLSSAVVHLGVAYDAAHDIGEAFLAAYGYATISGPGQHAAIGDFLAIVVDSPPDAALAAKAFDTARRARNSQNYRGTPVGAKQAQAVSRGARTLRVAATTRGVGT